MRELTATRLPSLLRHSDRNAMRWSVESRVPFLSPTLAALALSLPEHHLVSPEGVTKHVFREAMRGIVPDAVLDRRDKVAFAAPAGAWLSGWDPLTADTEVPFVDVQQARAGLPAMPDTLRWRLLNYAEWTGATRVSEPTAR